VWPVAVRWPCSSSPSGVGVMMQRYLGNRPQLPRISIAMCCLLTRAAARAEVCVRVTGLYNTK
ncbi:hypothetical protein EMIHUDRAFT_369056, partial [Emiliania huxleyi CCMP1516]|uniref:Uncharacterized protein n=2 Tax=Emiliania huxleyi TaxID=2903 RepID=A0A0D3JB23_EMIH1